MSDLLAARLTMAVSLGFHIILAAIGMVMPFLMCLAHRRWLKTGDEDAYRLTRAWMRGVAILFATGAVSGTALSFELGLLWPEFMRHAGPIFGMPFSLEGTAFFVEAIALGIYMYGWKRMPPRAHWWAGVMVGICGVSSGILVVSANGWMNAPTGFTWENGQAFNVDPWAALFNPAWATQASHMTLAAFESVAFAVMGVHALYLLRDPKNKVHRMALRIALPVAAVAALLQPVNGHWAAQDVAERQPAKLAAMESHFESGPRAPLILGGIPDEETQEVHYAIEIPGALSFLAFNDFDAPVAGLDSIPRDDWPPVAVVHFAFQIMVSIGTWLALLGALGLVAQRFAPRWLEDRRVLKLLVFSAPLGFVALEAGWVVTEVGRQPWIIYEIMRTKDAVTPVPGQVWHLGFFTLLYTVIGASTLWMLRRQFKSAISTSAPTPEVLAWIEESKA